VSRLHFFSRMSNSRLAVSPGRVRRAERHRAMDSAACLMGYRSSLSNNPKALFPRSIKGQWPSRHEIECSGRMSCGVGNGCRAGLLPRKERFKELPVLLCADRSQNFPPVSSGPTQAVYGNLQMLINEHNGHSCTWGWQLLGLKCQACRRRASFQLVKVRIIYKRLSQSRSEL
jgi:hypothetical protein